MQTVFEYEKIGKKGKIENFVLLSTSPRRKDLLAFLKPIITRVEVDERSLEELYMETFKQDDFLTRAAKVCCISNRAQNSEKRVSMDRLIVNNF